MKTYFQIAILLVCFQIQNLSAQDQGLQLTAKDSIVKSAWIAGLGINVVNDSATPGEDIFNVKETWNAVPYPSALSLGRVFSSGIGVKAIASYNRYKVGKKVDGAINQVVRNYYAFDGMVSYDLDRLTRKSGWFNPYVNVGAGYSSIGSVGRVTGNAGVGFNVWVTDAWGLNLSTMGKWSLNRNSTRQIQHFAGVLYRFGMEKELSKNGKEKLALIEEQQRVADSIVQADEQARLLADRLAQEKEAAQLAAAEKAKEDAENQRKASLAQAIKDLGNTYFALNSATLDQKSKELLDQLAAILQQNPSVVLNVNAYTDSRGTKPYNLKLSDKRRQQSVDYLISKGISDNRLLGQGYGEEHLVNECDDNTRCSEAKHSKNRRSEFVVEHF